MHNLTAITPLGGTIAQEDTIGSLKIREVPGVALASVSARIGGEKATSAALKKLTGSAAPTPGKATLSDAISAFWTGPDQWMLMAPLPGYEMLAEAAIDAFKSKASITEQTGGWARFDVEGRDTFDLFERLCALPVRKMAPGDANRTRIEHLECFVICTASGFSVLGPRSSAKSLHHALTTAASSVA
ncbi:MAG: sarcosine oxidase subunit gamma [Sulfitobacter sp.]